LPIEENRFHMMYDLNLLLRKVMMREDYQWYRIEILSDRWSYTNNDWHSRDHLALHSAIVLHSNYYSSSATQKMTDKLLRCSFFSSFFMSHLSLISNILCSVIVDTHWHHQNSIFWHCISTISFFCS